MEPLPDTMPESVPTPVGTALFLDPAVLRQERALDASRSDQLFSPHYFLLVGWWRQRGVWLQLSSNQSNGWVRIDPSTKLGVAAWTHVSSFDDPGTFWLFRPEAVETAARAADWFWPGLPNGVAPGGVDVDPEQVVRSLTGFRRFAAVYEVGDTLRGQVVEVDGDRAWLDVGTDLWPQVPREQFGRTLATGDEALVRISYLDVGDPDLEVARLELHRTRPAPHMGVHRPRPRDASRRDGQRLVPSVKDQ